MCLARRWLLLLLRRRRRKHVCHKRAGAGSCEDEEEERAAVAVSPSRALQRQYLYFCTRNASKLSTFARSSASVFVLLY